MGVEELTERARQLTERINGHPEHVAEVVPVLVDLIEGQDDPAVLAEAVRGLGFAHDEAASRAAAGLAGHADPLVRLAVARAVAHGEPWAAMYAETLIVLMGDIDDDVRDWATFGLGSQMEVDAPRIRAALWARLDDPVEIVRDEALVGLAKRHDPRCVDLVSARLDGDYAGRLVFEAAEYLGDARLFDLLTSWHDSNPDDDEIRDAWEACDPVAWQSRVEEHAAFLDAVERAIVAKVGRSHAALLCDRDWANGEVWLALDADGQLRSVDSVLNRFAGNVEQAAQFVTADINDATPTIDQ